MVIIQAPSGTSSGYFDSLGLKGLCDQALDLWLLVIGLGCWLLGPLAFSPKGPSSYMVYTWALK